MPLGTTRWALVWRPRRFADILGQPHVVAFFNKVLTSWFETGVHLPVGVLFSGRSGVGKTTMARVLAASLNCLHRKGVEPCGKCDSCEKIFGGLGGGVFEIDASFFGNVDNIRKLREQLMSYAFAVYQVIIIDECHMMSREASNVLLKLLEEAPKNLFFVLVTTEAYKLLETVKSRLLEFHFQSVKNSQAVEYIKKLLTREEVKCDELLILKMFRMSNGNIRDIISNLEQLSIASSGEITKETIISIFGNIFIFEQMIDFLRRGDFRAAYLLYKKETGVYADFSLFIEGFIGAVGDAMLTVMRDGGGDVLFYDKLLSGLYRFLQGSFRLNPEASARLLFFVVMKEVVGTKQQMNGEKKLLSSDDIFKALLDKGD